MRPPQRSRASTMVTLLPARASSRAVIRPAAPAPTIKKFVGCRGAINDRARTAGDDAPLDRSLCRSGRPFLVPGAERSYLAGGVLQLLILQLRRHVVLLGERQESAEPKRP